MSMFGDKLPPMPKDHRWNVVMKSLFDLCSIYNDRDAETVIPSEYRDYTLNDQVELALYQLVTAYNNWLD